MKALEMFSGAGLFIELGQHTLRILGSDQGLELPLARLDNGRLDPKCKDRLVPELTAFVRAQPWQSRQRALCALGGRGVSLRRFTLPKAPDDELRRLLRLQMESEFPLPPEALAWGYCRLPNGHNGANAGQELVVAALKRDLIDDYIDLFAKVGLTPAFTLAACARSSICSNPPPKHALLDIGRTHSEMVVIEDRVVTGIRILPWGEEDLTRGVAKELGVVSERAEQLQTQLVTAPADNELRERAHLAFANQLQSLTAGLDPTHQLGKVYLTSETGRPDSFLTGVDCLSEIRCEAVRVPPGPGHSAATMGLQRLRDSNGAFPRFDLQVEDQKRERAVSQPERWQWVGLAAFLLVTAVIFHYAESFLFRAGLSRHLSEIKGYRGGIPRIERELSFLQYLDSNQPPVLDALYVLAHAAPGGTRLESVSLNRRGEVSLRGVMANAQQATEFRSKLVDSGFFSSVVFDEQTPSPDRQRLQFRLSAQCKSYADRPRITPEAASKDASRPGMGGAPPGAGFMPGPMMAPPGSMMPPPGAMGPLPQGPGGPELGPRMAPPVSSGPGESNAPVRRRAPGPGQVVVPTNP